MRLTPTIAEVELLVNRVADGRIDLQPDFQRGNVWPLRKKQRLVDTVLRRWHIPPLHFIREHDGRQSVLDGQQRLSAIVEFCANGFPVDGRIDPIVPEIKGLHGYFFSDLPPEGRRGVLSFPIQVVDLSDYQAEEPFELFFRLNEPVPLTSAEKRNAFFGPAREEVRELVDLVEGMGWNKNNVGFTNSRMAYDDAIARLCLTLETGSLREQLSGAAVTRKYRSGVPFEEVALTRARWALQDLSSLPSFQAGALRFNRATLFSWLIFAVRYRRAARTHLDLETFDSFALIFATMIEGRRNTRRMSSREEAWPMAALLDVYEDRATARVLDVASVLLRDAVIAVFFAREVGWPGGSLESRLLSEMTNGSDRIGQAALYELIDAAGWSDLR